MNPRAWLSEVSWELVVWQNERLCEAKHAHHGPTSDGHEVTRELGESRRFEAMGLEDLAEHLRRCHRLAPFTN